MNRNLFYDNLNKYKQTNELMHYGTLGQKWGVRKWQNYDGTFNEAGKERYFGKSKAKTGMNEENRGLSSKSKTTEEEKVGSNKSNIKDYLKFRNKMLKQRTRSDLNQWYRDKMKDADKQLIKDAKRVDKQQMKMYKNQLKDFYDDPEELVNDLDRMYRIGSNDKKIGGLISNIKNNKIARDFNKEVNDDYFNNLNAIDKYLKNSGYGDRRKLFDDVHEMRYYKILNDDVDKMNKALYEDNKRTKKFEDAEAKAGIIKGLSESDNLIEIASNIDKYVRNWSDKNTIHNNVIATQLYDSDYDNDKIDDTIHLINSSSSRLRKEFDNYMTENIESYKKLNDKAKDTLFKQSSAGIAVNNANVSEIQRLNKAKNADDNMYDNYKKYSSRANKIMDKLAPSCKRTDHNEPNGWYLVWKAIDNLGYDNVNYNDLSQSDWDKINKEINDLKKE